MTATIIMMAKNEFQTYNDTNKTVSGVNIQCAYGRPTYTRAGIEFGTFLP